MSRLQAQSLLQLLQLHPSEEERPRLQHAWSELAQDQDLLNLLQYEGAALWLHRRIFDLGLDRNTPLADALRLPAHSALLLGMRVDAAAAEVLRLLHSSGFQVIPIKGPARRIAASYYPYSDARASSDVDLLLPADQARPAWEELKQQGYLPHETSMVDHFHLPGLHRPGSVTIELHTAMAPWGSPELWWQRQQTNSEIIQWQGLNVRVPSATELLWQAVTHAVIDSSEGLRLRFLLDGAVILASGREIDWESLTSRIESREPIDAEKQRRVASADLWGWLASAAQLAGRSRIGLLEGRRSLGLERLLRWKIAIFRRGFNRSLHDRLVDEASRIELGMGLIPPQPGNSALVRLRRLAGAGSARICYHTWRALPG